MEGFIKVIKKKNTDIDISRIISLLKDYKNTKHFTDIKQSSEIIDIYYTNEYTEYPYQVDLEEQFTPVGNFTISKTEVKKALQKNDLKFISNMQGSFAIGFSDLKFNITKLVTHISRIENIFHFENDEKIIVGTDPLLISMISSEKFVPIFDADNFYTFMQNGYYVDNNTPYKGVKSLPPNKYIIINNGITKIQNIDDSLENILSKPINDIDLDKLTEIFVNGFKTRTVNEMGESLALTGGKDSRIIFSVLKNLGMNFSVYTNGFKENPDVQIAKIIAEQYGYEHTINLPKIAEDNTLAVSPYKRMLNSMSASSGMIYGYDSITVSNKGYQGDKTFDGVAAGLSKGGYSAFFNITSEDSIINTFTANDELFLNTNKQRFKESLHNIIGEDNSLEQKNILSFLNFRTGRWTANAKLGKNYLKQQHSPFVDNLFLKQVLQIKYNDNLNDKIIYEIMKRLDFDITKIPFAMDRWKFEKYHPTTVSDFKPWLNRQELYPKTYLGNYNWRQIHNNDREVINNFKDLLLSNPSSVVYDSLDYKKIEQLFSKKLTAKHNKLLWAIGSLIVFEHYTKDIHLNLKKEKIKINMPGTKVTKNVNQPKTYNFSNKMESINNALKKLNNNTFEIIRNDKNIYLNSMVGKFTEKPKFKALNDQKTVVIGANITADKKSDIRIILVTYENEQRIENLTFYPIEEPGSANYKWTVNIKLKSNITHVRLLINIRDKEISNRYKINYLYMKL